MKARVRKAVIPAAGYGTRFLPIANAVGRAAVSDRLILGDMASLGISYWNPNMVGCKN